VTGGEKEGGRRGKGCMGGGNMCHEFWGMDAPIACM